MGITKDGKIVSHIYKLPNYKAKTYEILECIENTGTSYIDLSIPCNLIKEIDIKFSISTLKSDQVLFGAFTNSYRGSNYAQIPQNKLNIYGNGSAKTLLYSAHQTNKIFRITTPVTSSGTAYLYDENNTELRSVSGITPNQETSNMIIFTLNYNNQASSSHFTKMKLYHFKGIDLLGNQSLDLIPVKRLKDNAIGLLNTLNNTFYESSGDLVAYSKETPEYYEEEVVKVDYIENTDVAYIDINNPNFDYTNWKINGRINVKRKDNNDYPTLFGSAKTGWANSAYGFVVEKNSNNIMTRQGAYGSIISNKTSHIIGSWHNFELVSKNGGSGQHLTFYKEDGTVDFEGTSSFSGGNITSISPYLFRVNNTLSSSQYSMQCQLSYFKVYSGSVMIRDFIPVKYGNEYCMLDLVENKLYHNQGTGSFSGGSRVEVKEITKIFIEDGVKYAYLDYIGTTGTQYINLGNYQTESAKDVIETKFRFESLSSSTTTTYWLWNNQVSASSITSVSDFYSQGNKFMFRFGSNTSQSAMLTFPQDRSIHTFKVDGINRKVYFDGTVYGFPFSSSTGNVPFNLFRRITGVGYGSVYLYSFKITKNGVTKFDLIPAIRLSDNVKGLFDRSSKTFYTNSGTGTFLGNIKKIVLGGE